MKKFALFLMAALVLLPASVFAATQASTSLYVSAQIVGQSSISAGSLNFGTITPGISNSTMAYSNAAISVTAPNGQAYAVSMSAGYYFGAATAGWWTMEGSNGSYIPYVLFQDSSYSTLWGDYGYGDTNNYPPLSSSGTGATQSYTVYGAASIPANAVQGYYSDTVTVAINF